MSFESVLFRLRNRTFGRWELRGGLPSTQKSPRTLSDSTKEQQFYTRVLQRAVPESRTEGVRGFFAERAPKPELRLWEVGCRNWSYLPAVAEFFPGATTLTGVEVDGGRRHLNLYRRHDFARAHAAQWNQASRQPFVQAQYADFLELHAPPRQGGRVGVLSFFPFVSPGPAEAWGVPAGKYSDFGALIAHAQRGGYVREKQDFILTVHQGEWEAEIATEAYQAAGLSVVHHACLRASEYAGLWPSAADIYTFWVERQ